MSWSHIDHGPADAFAEGTAATLELLERAPDIAEPRPRFTANAYDLLAEEPTPDTLAATIDELRLVVEAQGRQIADLTTHVNFLRGYARGLDDRTAGLIRYGGAR